MDLALQSKVAVVTGSSHGIGFSIAHSLHEEGCKVILNGRDEQRLSEAVQTFDQHDVAFCAADVTTLEGCEQLIAKAISTYGKLDILICNVGLSRSVPPGKETSFAWREMIDSNFFPAVNMIEAARPHLKNTQGNIVCISSICGSEVIVGAPSTYAVAKAALNMAIKTLARPLGVDSIRINAVAPGNILFPGSVWDKKLKQDEAAVNAMLDQEVALKRLGFPEEVANTVAFLASPKSAFTTGRVFEIDGGQVRN